MKILWQSLSEADWKGPYRDGLREHAQTVAHGLAEVSMRGLPAGSFGGHPPMELLRYPYASLRLMSVIPDLALDAERQGYDSLILGSYTEPLVREVRSLVDIPVATTTEATLLAACSMARKIGLITITRPLAQIIQEHVAAHGLADRVGEIVVLEPEVFEDDLLAGFLDPTRMVEAFKSAALLCVQSGADIIIPGEVVLSELLRQAGVTEVHGAPVVDCVGVAVTHAIFLTLARARANLMPGRLASYPRLSPELYEVIEEACSGPLSQILAGGKRSK